MNEETISAVMLASNPTRGLTDHTLDELFPLSLLTARIYESVADDFATVAAITRVPLWRRASALMTASAAAAGLVVAGIISVSGSPTSFAIAGVALPPQLSAQSLSPRLPTTQQPVSGPTVQAGVVELPPSVPVCRPGQMRETLQLHSVNGVTTFGWRGTVSFENQGSTCYVRRTWVVVMAVAGATHRVVETSVQPSSVLSGGYFVLGRFQSVRAPMTIYAGGPRSSNSCEPKVVDGVVVPSLFRHWPSEFFALPARLRVCPNNPPPSIVGGFLVKERS